MERIFHSAPYWFHHIFIPFLFWFHHTKHYLIDLDNANRINLIKMISLQTFCRCNMLLTETRQLVVLKVVNFQRLTFTAIDYMMHHHEKDLLCMSARAGNRAARSIVGKVTILHNFTNCFLSAFIGGLIWASGWVWVEGVNFQSRL